MTQHLLDAIKSMNWDAARAIARAEPKLLDRRDAEGLLPAVLALYRGASELANELVPVEESLTIFEAALFGRTQRLQTLIREDESGVRAYSPDGFTPLHLAIFSHNAEIARLLLTHGADIEAPATGSTAPGARPLQTAAFAREYELAKVLLEAGADPNAGEDAGGTPLLTARANDDERLERLLLDHGAVPEPVR